VLDIKTIKGFRYSTVYAVCVLSSQNYRQKFQVCLVRTLSAYHTEPLSSS